MQDFTSVIESLGTVTTISELNKSYYAAIIIVRQMQAQGMWDGIADADQLCKDINHITNYNIVRVARLAYDKYIASGKSDSSCQRDILLCYDSIKEHEDNAVEIDILSCLCEDITTL